MKQLKNLNIRQGGFIGVIFVAIALLAIVMVALGLMSRSSNGSTSEQSAKTNASILLKQTSDFKIGFDTLVLKIAPSAVTFDTAANTGLFDPSANAKYAVKHIAPSSAQTASTSYSLHALVSLPGIGAAGNSPDVVAVLPNVTAAVCKQIHKALYNDDTGTFATSAGSLADWTGGVAAINDSASVSAVYLNHFEGCVAASGSELIYYKALAEQ